MRLGVLAAICGLLILFGALAALDTAREVRLGLRSFDWPAAQGEIIRSRRGRSKSSLKRLEYRYVVGGKELIGGRAAFVRVPYVNPIHKAYRPGLRVVVRYNPADPTEAVLEPGAPVLGVLAEALVALVLIGLGGAAFLYGARR